MFKISWPDKERGMSWSVMLRGGKFNRMWLERAHVPVCVWRSSCCRVSVGERLGKDCPESESQWRVKKTGERCMVISQETCLWCPWNKHAPASQEMQMRLPTPWFMHLLRSDNPSGSGCAEGMCSLCGETFECNSPQQRKYALWRTLTSAGHGRMHTVC